MRYIFLFIGLLTTLGCQQGDSPQSTPQSTPQAKESAAPMITGSTPKVQVKVLANGDLIVDGKPATLDEVDQRFAELAKTKGAVMYYREGGEAEPLPNGKRVIELVIKHRLPISISSKPDFSDSIDENGVSHPRSTSE
jgi:hypothetical protein